MVWTVLLAVALAQQVPDDLPPLLRARALLAAIEKQGLEGDAAFQAARQALDAALQTDLSVDAKNFPNALKFLGPPEWIAAKAWLAYEKHRDPKRTSPRPFPERRKSAVARCDHEVVDESAAYLKIAFEAGPDTFSAALLTLRSPVEIGSALAMLPHWEDARAVPAGMELMGKLRRAVTSRREYEAADELKTQIQRFAAFAPVEFREEIEAAESYYETRNRALPACPTSASGTSSEDDADFSVLKRRVMNWQGGAEFEWESVEKIIKVYQYIERDPNQIEELVRVENQSLRYVIGELLQAIKLR